MSNRTGSRTNCINRARHHFAALERDHHLKDALEVRDYLRYAEAGFGVLDPDEKTSDREMERKLNKLTKCAYMKEARECLSTVLEKGSGASLDRLFESLALAGEKLSSLASERGISEAELVNNIAWSITRSVPNRQKIISRGPRLS